jgi:hypothetical protein
MFMALLGLIPGLSSLVSSITTAIFDAKVKITQAKIGGDRDVAVKLVQAAAEQEHENTARLSIIAGNKLLTFLLIAFAMPIVIWFNKIVSWDIVLAPIITGETGMTDPIKGQALEIVKIVIYFLFGAPTVMGIGKMWFTRKTS